MARLKYRRASAGKAAFLQEQAFIGRGVPAQYVVAMREAAEALDDVVMTNCVLQKLLAGILVQADRKFLIGQILGMRERQVEEDASRCVDLLVMAGSDRFSGEVASERVGRIHVTGAAEAVARELVEQDHEGERAAPEPGKPKLTWPGGSDDKTVKSMRGGLEPLAKALNALATGLNLTVRNVTTHTRTELSEQEAMERLAAYSYLARLLDRCETASADAEESDQ